MGNVYVMGIMKDPIQTELVRIVMFLVALHVLQLPIVSTQQIVITVLIQVQHWLMDLATVLMEQS